MSESNKQDRLIEDALALLQEAVRKEPFDVKNMSPHAQLESVATKVVVATEYPDGHRSVVAASSSSSIMTGHEPDQHQGTSRSPTIEHQNEEVMAPEPSGHSQALVDQTLSMMRIASEELKTASSASATTASAKMPDPKSWLDIERTEMRRRTEAFRATQQRFQREREEYCADALAAAQAGNWKSQQT